jgi:hypothetical protein
MNTQLLIDTVVQQTMVFIAQLATKGGIRAPLVRVADQVFSDLTRELHQQGVKKKVIADMFGMALRTYHRKARELGTSRTDTGRTLWEAVFEFVKAHEPVTGARVKDRFQRDDGEIVTGVLSDLVHSGIAYRSGRGDGAVYRIADEGDFHDDTDQQRREASEYVVWLTVYRHGPINLAGVVDLSRVLTERCKPALESLVADGRLRSKERDSGTYYESDEFFVPLGTARGWEAAVLDHYQAMVSAITSKIAQGRSTSERADTTGGSTWSLDVWRGHPMESEALGTLGRIRAELEALRERVDAHNADSKKPAQGTRVVYYMGQYVQPQTDEENEQ